MNVLGVRKMPVGSRVDEEGGRSTVQQHLLPLMRVPSAPSCKLPASLGPVLSLLSAWLVEPEAALKDREQAMADRERELKEKEAMHGALGAPAPAAAARRHQEELTQIMNWDRGCTFKLKLMLAVLS